jgi:hypothetical protein
MRIANRLIVAGVLLSAVVPTAMAQLELSSDTASSCAEIEGLRKAGNLSEARDKANLCLQALDQELAGEVGKLFPTSVAGWTRTSMEQNQALGFTNVTAEYEKGENTTNVSLTGGASGSGLGGLLGGFARAGIASSGKQVRVGGLPATVQPDGSIMVTLEDGSFLSFQSPQFDDADAALAGIGDLVNAFPVADINKAVQ